MSNTPVVFGPSLPPQPIQNEQQQQQQPESVPAGTVAEYFMSPTDDYSSPTFFNCTPTGVDYVQLPGIDEDLEHSVFCYQKGFHKLPKYSPICTFLTKCLSTLLSAQALM